jgi:Transglycosylase-like domain
VSHPPLRAGLRRYAYQGRHRAVTSAGTAIRPAVLSAGVVAAVMVGTVAPASAAPSGDAWYRLRMCESGNNYRANTGNGYYGAYQFDLSTWRSVGGTGLPSDASPAEQDYRARLLYQARGWAPWGCARTLGLREDPGYGRHAAVTPTIRAPRGASPNATVRVAGTARPGALVELWRREVMQAEFRHVRNVRADRNGRWTTAFRLGHTSFYFARAEGRRSRVVTIRLLMPTKIVGPGARNLNDTYRIAGRARPNRTVTVYFRASGQRAFTPRRWVRSDRHGLWSTTWRASTDYQYFARGDVRSRIAGTRVATTVSSAPALTPLAAGPHRVMVTGTARPSSAVAVYVRTAGSGTFVPLAQVRVQRTGHYTAGFAVPSRSFDYFAISSNRLRSGVRHSVA